MFLTLLVSTLAELRIGHEKTAHVFLIAVPVLVLLLLIEIAIEISIRCQSTRQLQLTSLLGL